MIREESLIVNSLIPLSFYSPVQLHPTFYQGFLTNDCAGF